MNTIAQADKFPSSNYRSTTNTYYWKNRKPFEGYWQQDVHYKIKAAVDEKGGAAISASYVSGKPIIYLGIGQKYSDLEKFSKNKILKSLEL